MIMYIKKNIGFFHVEQELSPSSNVIGITEIDYHNGCWILLNEAQVTFTNANPNATPLEALRMELTPIPEPKEPEPIPEPEPYVPTIEDQIITFLIAATPVIFNTASIDDKVALQVPALHPLWENLKGQTLHKGYRLKDVVNDVETLYITLQPILIVDDENQRPGNGAMKAIYSEVVDAHDGTLDDPIPYDHMKGMFLEVGFYYTEEGILYVCTREIQASHPLRELVGHNVEVA